MACPLRRSASSPFYDFREPLPGLPDATRKQVAGHAEVAVTNQALAVRVAWVQDFDSHLAGLDDLSLLLRRPKDRPYLFGCGVEFERKVALLQFVWVSDV